MKIQSLIKGAKLDVWVLAPPILEGMLKRLVTSCLVLGPSCPVTCGFGRMPTSFTQHLKAEMLEFRTYSEPLLVALDVVKNTSTAAKGNRGHGPPAVCLPRSTRMNSPLLQMPPRVALPLLSCQ
jgi:hypothetical protein